MCTHVLHLQLGAAPHFSRAGRENVNERLKHALLCRRQLKEHDEKGNNLRAGEGGRAALAARGDSARRAMRSAAVTRYLGAGGAHIADEPQQLSRALNK